MWKVGGSVKSFYSAMPSAPAPVMPPTLPLAGRAPRMGIARIAVYDSPGAAPRVVEIAPAETAEYIEELASRVYELARDAGGRTPYTVIRELTENLIHADFREPVVSILERGHTIRFADQGPGISDKDRAILPGFTTASGEMKMHIRGVGSGLPIVREFLSVCGGSLLIEDNLGRGSVVTIAVSQALSVSKTPVVVASDLSEGLFNGADKPGAISERTPIAPVRLTSRQKQVLALVVDNGEAGPSLVAKELGIGVSTAYRDLTCLEEQGLIELSEGRKRSVTESGLSLLDDLMHG